MKVGDLVRFKSNRADYKEFHGHVGLVVSIEESGIVRVTGDYVLYPVVRWLEPVLVRGGRLAAESHFHDYRFEVIE
jgi:hypothetical protein